jgi:hypothetical protein
MAHECGDETRSRTRPMTVTSNNWTLEHDSHNVTITTTLKTFQFYEGVEAEQRRPPQLYGLCSLTIWRSMHESSKVVTPGEYFSTFTRSLKLRTSHVRTARLMDEGTLKTPIPKCRLYWSFLFGVV